MPKNNSKYPSFEDVSCLERITNYHRDGKQLNSYWKSYWNSIIYLYIYVLCTYVYDRVKYIIAKTTRNVSVNLDHCEH